MSGDWRVSKTHTTWSRMTAHLKFYQTRARGQVIVLEDKDRTQNCCPQSWRTRTRRRGSHVWILHLFDLWVYALPDPCWPIGLPPPPQIGIVTPRDIPGGLPNPTWVTRTRVWHMHIASYAGKFSRKFKGVLYSILGPYLVGLTATVWNIVGRLFSAVCSGLNHRRYSKSNYKIHCLWRQLPAKKLYFLLKSCDTILK